MATSAPPTRPGMQVWLNGREARLLYARGKGAVVRYAGESRSRVVALDKLTSLPCRRP